MDTLCGIGLPELIIIALVGFVVIGPQRTREIALTAGRWLRRVMRSEWWREFNQIATALRDLPTTLVRMAELEDDIRQVRTDINRAGRVGGGEVPLGDISQPPAIDPDNDPWGIGTTPASDSPPPVEPPSPGDKPSDD